jgi:GR25 family glycosyltransferase involved in LPS biosynthesis
MNSIPTFVINLKRRVERREHILKEFNQRKEFDITVVEAQEHKIGAIGLWNTLQFILKEQLNKAHEYIIVCEDDHQFTDAYSKELLFSAIAEVRTKNADILCGGVSWFTDALAISPGIFWVDKFSGFQFTVIFRHFFTTILNADFNEEDVTDLKIASLSENKFFIFPFISVQKDFGYSDVTNKNNTAGRVDGLFSNSSNKAKTINYICNYYKVNRKRMPVKSSSASYDNFIIPTYVVCMPERPDRVAYIKAQFKEKDEFDITLVEGCKNEMDTVSWYLSIRKIVKMAIANDDDIIVICKDDLKFTEYYSKEDFLQNIMEAFYQRTEMLAGGVGEFGIAIPVAENRFWINAFHAAGFFVLYKSIFQKILEQGFDDNITVGQLFTKITDYKMALFPFIVIQNEFDGVDMTWNRAEDEESKLLFPATENRFALVKSVYDKHCGILTHSIQKAL